MGIGLKMFEYRMLGVWISSRQDANWSACGLDSIPFISVGSDLYLIKIDLEMELRKYRKTTGLPMWHRRLMHCPLQNIIDTIPFTKGMEKLKNCRIDPREKCAACAIGKSTYQDDILGYTTIGQG
jgi:hypothetical protein